MTEILLLSFYAIAATLFAIWFFIELVRSRRQVLRAIEINKHNQAANEHNQTINEQAALATQQLINCAKLVSIHSNGRLRIFTFARNDEMFTIETMGLLGDDVGKWKQQAGLSE